MGKSPGKWIKTVLFGRKTSRSNLSKGREVSKTSNEKEEWAAPREPAADLTVGLPLTSHLAHDITDRNGEYSEGLASNLPHEEVTLVPGNQVADKPGIAVSDAANDAERIKLEQAATNLQAAFRGYLARRAFRALKGIIRLQALVRGHLVRRQAIATLHCMQGIVKLQALVRGRRVRHSDTGLEVYKNCSIRKPLDAKLLESSGVNASTQTKKPFANVFVNKLLASSPSMMPLRLEYSPSDPNSAQGWLERWTSSRFWQPLSQAKKSVDSKSQPRQGNQTVETEPGRPKRSVRRVFTANVENGSVHSTSESEKPKRNPRKVLSHPVDSVPEHPQNELEKVKRSLRKVSNSTTEASERVEVEIEKPKRILRKTSSSPAPDVSDHGASDSAEKMKKDTTVPLSKQPEVAVSKQPEVAVSKQLEVAVPKRLEVAVPKQLEVVVSKQPDVETTPKPLAADEPVHVLQNDQSAVELLPLENSGKVENIPATNGELCSKEDQTNNENQKSKRRASLPAKQEYLENGIQNTPTVPSYMAATESAKAKLRGQGSPRIGQDVPEKNGFTRRHSLPASTYSKLSSVSPRTQKLVQASGKGGTRSEKSLLSSRDGNERVMQAEWRR